MPSSMMLTDCQKLNGGFDWFCYNSFTPQAFLSSVYLPHSYPLFIHITSILGIQKIGTYHKSNNS